MGKAIIYLADGTEECEALLCADLLRRAGAEVVLAAVGGRWEIVSSHGVAIRADALAEEADIAGTDLLVLPGGWPGTKHLEDCPAVQEAVLAFAAAGKNIPLALSEMRKFGGDILCSPEFGPAGSDTLANGVVWALGKVNKAALVKNHGAACIGENFREAWQVSVLVEKLAQTCILAETLGGVVQIPDEYKK